ncbi:MAG TPA: tetratricopeptide repeat protein, partial [Chthoniobacteraceae bacterium]
MPIRRTFATLLLLTAPLQAQVGSEKIVERYKQMLAASPVEGTALERLWKVYLDQGKTEQLIAEFRAPGTFASELVLGHLLRKAGSLDEAQAAYERAAALDPKSAQPILSLARLCAGAGKSREAATWFEKAVALLPKTDAQLPEVLLQLGTQWLALGDLNKAAEAWEMTVAANPKDLELRRRLADTYAQNHLPARAITHIEFLEKNSPPAERALALQQLARLHQSAGNQDAAIAALEKALALTTQGNWLRSELQSQLIRLHQRYHRTAELEQRWKKYAGDNPRDLAGYLQLIDFYERLGDLEQQRVWLEKLTQAAPKSADFRLRLARLLVQMDNRDAAAAIYDVLLKEQPANPDFVFERARLDVQNDATKAARDRIQRLLELRDKDESLRMRALDFYTQHRLNEALEQHLVADTASGSDEAMVALAQFYFRERREADALRTLQRLIYAQDPPEKRAAAHFRIAQILKTQNHLAGGVLELEKATQLQPAAREYPMLLGELQAARAQLPEAQAAYRQALALSKTPAEELEAEQKLFEVFRLPPLEESTAIRRGGSGFTFSPMPAPTAAISPALAQHLSTLTATAQQQPSEAAWLRVARWQSWSQNQPAAEEAIRQALELNPKSVPAHELLVKLSSAQGPTPAAVFHLMKLVEIDPAGRVEYQRRAGRLELQAGRINEAMALFEQLTKEAPGNLDALTDLALTQQRAERWTEALDSWRKIYALSPASKKKEAFGPLLRVLERLERHAQSAELQLKAVQTEAGEREQFTLFDELLAHCVKHNLLDWLLGEFQQRRKLRVDDYFTEMALGRILKHTGNKAAAFEVLADASYAAPNQAAAIPELVREAEDLRKLDAAVKLQAQLVRIAPPTHPEAFEKLAQLQEKNLELEEAGKTWDRIVSKFPRDTAMLGRAVDFQLRWGSSKRALELLRRVRALEPGNLQALSTLAELEVENGGVEAARACLEQIIASLPAEAADAPLVLPSFKAEDPLQLQTAYLAAVRQRRGSPSADVMRALRSFWTEEPADGKGEREQRLGAIRRLAELIRANGEQAAAEAWIARWRQSGSSSEALWALYYLGAGGALLDRVEAIIAEGSPDPKLPQAYIWFGLETGEFDRLGKWLQDRRRTVAERDYLLVALGRFLNLNRGEADAKLVGKLFPRGSNTRLWQAAGLFAARQHFREAVELGERVFSSASTRRGAYGRELASWYLKLGELDKARETLAASVAGSGESFEADVYAALHDYYFLLPEAQRAEFVTLYLGRINEATEPLHLALAGTLLRGLSGEDAAARKHLDALVNLHALAPPPRSEASTPSTRRWQLLLDSGRQLQSWRLDRLAIYVWEKALADDALIQLQGEQTLEAARDLRLRLAALQIALADPAEAQQRIAAFGGVSGRELQGLAEALEAMGAQARAIEAYRQHWELEPQRASDFAGYSMALRNLLKACHAGGDLESAEAALWKTVANSATLASDAGQRELLLQLVDLLERKGNLEQARQVIASAAEAAPSDGRLIMRLAQLHERARQPALAEAVYRRLLTLDSGNIAARLALATLLENEKRPEAAVPLLAKAAGPEVDARLAILQVKSGQIEEGLATLDRVSSPQHVTPALTVATSIAERGDRRLARSVVQSSIARTVDPGMSFPLLCKAVELLTPEDGAPTAQRELRRLRQAALGKETLLASYLEFAQTQAERLGLTAEFSAELKTLWSAGTGPIAAGTVLLAAELKRNAADAEKTLEQLLARRDGGEVWPYRIATVLEGANRPEWLVRVREHLARSNPALGQAAIDWARSLDQLGRKAEARAALEQLQARTPAGDELAGKIAQAFAQLGDPARARKLFAEAVRHDPFVRLFHTHLDFARLQLAERDFSGAKRSLRAAFSNPANREFPVILDWLAASRQLEQADAALLDLGLTGGRHATVRRALAQRLVAERKL